MHFTRRRHARRNNRSVAMCLCIHTQLLDEVIEYTRFRTIDVMSLVGTLRQFAALATMRPQLRADRPCTGRHRRGSP
jgi:hypothetical protein